METKETLRTPTRCFFQVSIGGEIQPKRIVVELDVENCPKTTESCVSFCLCAQTMETTTPKSPQPSYRGCEFHRIIPGFMVQTGDFERFDGTGGYSPLFGRNFDDEYLKGKHDGPGVVSMANSGKNKNGSQFFITLQAAPHLDGKHVVFGKVVSGMESVHKMVHVERDKRDRPVLLQKIVITDCGLSQNVTRRVYSTDHRHTKQKRKKRKQNKDDDDSSNESSSSDESLQVSDRRKGHSKKCKRRSRNDSNSSVDSDSSSSYARRKRKHDKKRKKRDKEKRRRLESSRS
jgi:peptidyl-prolyl isomerase G (cyclophilin G)